MASITSVELKIGLEVHIELSTRRKMFAPSGNIAHPEFAGAAPNTLLDPVVLALPGALPVMNQSAIEMSVLVGLALGCQIAKDSVWDRKSYFYPDMPKAYQISQYQLPLCFDGSVTLPPLMGDGRIDFEKLASGAPETGQRIGIIRAHLEEDAGKLLHDAPGGGEIDCSLVDLNRSGTPLLEVVTAPDFTSADQVVIFCQMLRSMCRFLDVSEGVMQKGHIRFEPNINCFLTLSDGKQIRTPIVEVKNLNSFKAVRGAIEYELKEQPGRWEKDGRVMGPGTKSTRGWDDQAHRTTVQREKEDAHDYRYFPDPDLPPVYVSSAWRDSIAARMPELPLARARRYVRDYALTPKEAASLTDERDVCFLYESVIAACTERGISAERAGRMAANFLLQSGAKRANERSTADWPVLVSDLGLEPSTIGAIITLREHGLLSASSADTLFGLVCAPWRKSSDEAGDEGSEHGATPEQIEGIAKSRGLLMVKDAKQLEAWCLQAISENAKSAEDVRAGKLQALGRLVGAVMKLAGGQADAASARVKLLEKLGVSE